MLSCLVILMYVLLSIMYAEASTCGLSTFYFNFIWVKFKLFCLFWQLARVRFLSECRTVSLSRPLALTPATVRLPTGVTLGTGSSVAPSKRVYQTEGGTVPLASVWGREVSWEIFHWFQKTQTMSQPTLKCVPRFELTPSRSSFTRVFAVLLG